MALRWKWKWNLNTTTTISSRSAPALVAIPSPWPGARRDCLGVRPRRSSSAPVSTAGGIVPLYNSGVRPLRMSAIPSPCSSPLQEKGREDGDYDDKASSLCGGGGGRGGGGDEAGGAGDWEDDGASKEVQVCPLLKRELEEVIADEGLIGSALEIINAAAATVLASIQKNPTIRFLLRLLAPFSKGTVLCGVALITVMSLHLVHLQVH